MRDTNTMISLELPKELLQNIKIIAKSYGLTTSAFIRMNLYEISKSFNNEKGKSYEKE